MENNYNKKFFITISSGILLSLATNQQVAYAVETTNEVNNRVITIVDRLGTKNDLVLDNPADVVSKENEVLIKEIKLSIVNKQTYHLSGTTFKNSEIILIVDTHTKYIVQSDEQGFFELTIKDLSKNSSIQSFITYSEKATYTAEFTLQKHIEQLDKVNHPGNDQNLDIALPNETGNSTQIEGQPIEKPVGQPIEKPVGQPIEKPVGQPIEKPVDQPIEKPVDQPIEKPVDQPIEKPVKQPTEKPAEEPVEKPLIKPVKQSFENTFSMMQVDTLSTLQAVNGVYIIKSGDSLGLVSSSFKISLSQLLSWNPQIKNANLVGVGERINVTKAAYDKYIADNKGNNQAKPRPFKTNKEFIDFITPYAIQIANATGQNKLYASVMIAQAAHESNFGKSLLSLPQHFNLFGIKGSYNGQSIPMGTWEDTGGGIINITANFRSYPSYYESMMDYADLLRTGLTGSPNFYSKTWVKNTNSYKDATKYLTGTYATDTLYNVKVNNIIELYNLTQYDTFIVDSNISNTRNVSYSAVISLNGYSIDTKPWGTPGFSKVDNTNTYLDANVQVIKETIDGKYALISYNGSPLGWVDKRALTSTAVVIDIASSQAVNYKATVIRNWFSIDTRPWGQPGYQSIGKTLSYINTEVDVIRQSGNYVLISLNGNALGWVDKKALSSNEVVIDIASSQVVNYKATVIRNWFSIDTKPWGHSGYQTIGKTLSYMNAEVDVIRQSGNYVLISLNGNPLGWVDKKALQTQDVVENIPSSQVVNYKAKVIRNWFSIDTKPWGHSGYQTISKTLSYINAEVDVIRQSGSYVLISLNGTVLGWVDKKALETNDVVTDISSSQPVNYNATIIRNWFSIDTKPWGQVGFKNISHTRNYVGTQVHVTRRLGSYVLIYVNGKAIGWVDIKALNI